MRNIKIWGLFILSSLFVFTSCEEEKLTPFDDFSEGADLVASAPVPNFFGLQTLTSSATDFTVDAIGTLAVSSVDLYATHKDGTGAIAAGPTQFKSVSSLPAAVNVTAAEIMTALNITEADVAQGQSFEITMTMETASGTLAPNTKVVLDVSCPSSLEGDYSVTTTYSAHDCLDDYPSNTTDVTVTKVADGIYSIADISGGLYSEGCYVDLYTTSGVAGEIKEVCGAISWEGVVDPWQNLLAVDGFPNSVDPVTGVITITMSGDVYGETWTSVYTPL